MTDTPADHAKRFQPIPGYEILAHIGSGGMGTIFKALQISMNRVVALKILKKKDLSDPLPLDRMRREALLIARMDHTHIVKGIDMGETDRYYFFAMEFIEGRSVKSMLDLFGPIDELRAVSIILDVAKALQYVFEQKLTHRDVKPGNILISDSGHTKLTDLGLAKADSDLTLTREGTTLGTPQYISPEQARFPKAVDIRSDIYSLGATFYHMVTGSMPFEGDSMAQVLTHVLFDRPALPETLKPSLHRGTSRVISRMMAKKQSQRYQTPADLIKDLHLLIGILEGRPDETATPLGMAWRKSQRRSWAHPAVLLSAAALVVVLFFCIAYGLVGNQDVAPKPVSPDTGLASLQLEYESGGIPPARLLRELATLSLESERDREMRSAFRERVLADCRRMIEDMLAPSSSRFDRALAEGGILRARAQLIRIASQDLVDVMGEKPQLLPPTLTVFWDEKMKEAEALMATRIQSCCGAVQDRAEEILAEHVALIDSKMAENNFSEAWALMEKLRSGARDILRQAALDFFKGLGAYIPAGSLDPDRFIDDVTAVRISERTEATAEGLAQVLQAAAEDAQAGYVDRVREAAVGLINNADLTRLKEGVSAMIREADKDIPRPSLPMISGMRWPGLDALEPELAPLVAMAIKKLQEEKGRTGSRSLFREIDEALGQGDYPLALERIEQADPDAAHYHGFGDSWRRRIKTLQALEKGALQALNTNTGLDCRIKTGKGVIYEGEIQAVDPAGKTISIKIKSGQILTLALDDLSIADVLLWSEKVMIIKPDCKGLFYYYKGDFENAAMQLKEARDFEEAPLYIEWIEKRNDFEQRAQEKEARAIKLLLDETEEALKEKKWEEGLELLDTCKAFYRSTPGWNETRKRRARLQADLEELKRLSTHSAQLARLFSVPITMLDDNRVGVHYDFSSKVELNDFTAYGQNWEIRNNALVCGSAQSMQSPDYFHNSVGVRIEKPFDTDEVLVLTFDYRAPLEGSGPEFMGIAFYGSCFGVRSFRDKSYEGQVNFWIGDLEEYGDYFFIPDFGESRPKKGRVVSFAFQRGEKYRVSVHWTSARELLFSVDEKEIYRTRAFKPKKGAGMEIRTFREAVIESLTLEGKIKN
ncbi:MAG: serine/threonine-protein kinase [Planctomycetota bacterium]